MEKAKIDRINELAHKSKREGLNDAEKEEQRILRQEFLAEIRADFKATLESMEPEFFKPAVNCVRNRIMKKG